MMRGLFRAPAFACLAAGVTAGCAGEQPPAGTITGRERLGWSQQAPDAAELGQYSYVLYVDGSPVDLTAATCGALAGDGPAAACSSPLPPLSGGRHTLELATRIVRDDRLIESEKSASLSVTISGAGTASAMGGAGWPAAVLSATQTAELRLEDGSLRVVEMVASGLDRPSALARLPDGRLLVAERRGRLLFVQKGSPGAEVAARLADVDAEAEGNISLALAPDFEGSRHVYVGYAVLDELGSSVGRVVRLREAAGTLGEAVVVIDGLPVSGVAPRVRIGPGGALFVATSTGRAGIAAAAAGDTADAGDIGEADDLASYAGKILRFTADGGTAAGNPFGPSPVFSSGHRGRLDFDWDPASGALWHLEATPAGTALGCSQPGKRGEREAFLQGVMAAGAAFYDADEPLEWRGSLFLAVPSQGCVIRLSGLGESPPKVVVERLLEGQYGRITSVLAAADGLYFLTGNGGTDAAGRPADGVYRVSEGRRDLRLRD